MPRQYMGGPADSGDDLIELALAHAVISGVLPDDDRVVRSWRLALMSDPLSAACLDAPAAQPLALAPATDLAPRPDRPSPAVPARASAPAATNRRTNTMSTTNPRRSAPSAARPTTTSRPPALTAAQVTERDRVVTAAIRDGRIAASRGEHYRASWAADPAVTRRLLTASAADGGLQPGVITEAQARGRRAAEAANGPSVNRLRLLTGGVSGATFGQPGRGGKGAA